ncbi:hypothetical protein F5Y19DRAFT_400989 [Xylariaceae sp. FL1651]|nr:hypothetical protein F5Y19DRAFT_400989 [Xylariaceae sp. FL1651]
MDDHNTNTSCLSAESHNNNITNHVLHYFGCLEACERDTFFDPSSPFWVHEINKYVEAGLTSNEARVKADKRRVRWQQDCTNELQRVAFLLSALATDDEESQFLKLVANSRDAWRSSYAYRSNIGHVREWRAGRGCMNGVELQTVSSAPVGVYDPDRDLKVSIMEFEDGVPQDDDDPRVKGRFPDQTTTVEKLLQRDGSRSSGLLSRDRLSNRIKWFHIPLNNMSWVEELMASYYEEERPSIKQMRHEHETLQAARLLRDHFWRGQQYKDVATPKSRFMRPFCKYITPTRRSLPHTSENIVLYAPFLHWETSRQLAYFTREIDKHTASTKEHHQQEALLKKEIQKQQRSQLRRPDRHVWAMYSYFMSSRFYRMPTRANTFSSFSPYILNLLKGRLSRPPSKLGQYLFDAARLYERIRNYRDKSLLRKYLFADPPIHPRRTLDQGYYTTLSSTRTRDRNQVVYRATTPAVTSCHKFITDTGEWTCFVNTELSPEGCDICRENIRKVSRVVMIDQLWMWVLDQKTIITFFPQRYGVSGRDPSGIFESVQQRLSRGKPVQSVFDIAHTVFDECSNSLFDLKEDSSGRPQVLDIFSEAVRNVSRKQTIELQRLWDWMDRARKINREQTPHRKLEIPIWTVGVEGELEKEIQDIVEELEIMISVKKTQLDVYNKFIRHASQILNPNRVLDRSGMERELKQARLAYDRFQFGASGLMRQVKEWINDLENLLKSASNAAKPVKDLSQLRQQQDSVIQALQSVKLSADSVEQGRAITVFTIVTIIFSPLSFLSSVFGMNNVEFGDNHWTIRDQLKLILPISFGVIILALVFASSRLRATAVYIATLFGSPRQALRWTAVRISVTVFTCISWIFKTSRRAFQKF